MNRKPDVCLLTNFIPPYYVPIFRHLRLGLGRFRIFVSTPVEPNRNWPAEWADLPVTVQKCWTLGTTWKHESGFAEKIFRHFPYDTIALLKCERPDVVISAQLGARSLQAVIYRKLFPASRLIIWTAISEETERGLGWLRTAFRKTLLRAADAVLANGESAKRYLSSLGERGNRVLLLPYCAAISPLLDLPLTREPAVAKRLLFVGQLVARKGLAAFLQVLSSWLKAHPFERCEFWIAGDGPLRGELETFPTTPRLQIRLLGSVAYEQLAEIYAQGGIYVFPTLADEWGVVVNEAMAAGLPVLGSLYSQAVEELVEEGSTGWTFRPDRPEEMYAALDRAMTAPKEQLNKMRCAARSRISRLTSEYGAQCFLEAIDFVRFGSKRKQSSVDRATEKSESAARMELPTL